MTKLLFSDLDGTLLTDDKKIPSGLLEDIRTMTAEGHKLILSTGRPLLSALEVFRQLSLAPAGIYLIAYNGALVYDLEHQCPVMESVLPVSDVRYLMNRAYTFGLHCHTYHNEQILSERDTPELAAYTSHIHLPVRIEKDVTACLDTPPYKIIVIHYTDKERLLSYQKDILPYTESRDITTVFSSDSFLELFSKKAGKGNAVRFLCDYLSAAPDASFAVGDALNDLSMLEAAHMGIAMRNACPELRNAADFVTSSDNNNGGVSEIIRRFIL